MVFSSTHLQRGRKKIQSWSFIPALNHWCLAVEAFKANGGLQINTERERKFVSVFIWQAVIYQANVSRQPPSLPVLWEKKRQESA